LPNKCILDGIKTEIKTNRITLTINELNMFIFYKKRNCKYKLPSTECDWQIIRYD
jgi:hypothetical protein